MTFQALKKYITHLYTTRSDNTNIWINDSGQAQGRYFNSTLTSVFQAIRSSSDHRIIGYHGLARSYGNDNGDLSLWRLLDHAANDDESVELDRLCRLLHAINFYRQVQSADQNLYLNVHARLLAAVEGNHGAAFRRILNTLELPHQHIVLELPAIVKNQGWMLNHIAENYQRNGFRLAINVSSTEQGLELLKRRHFDTIRIDSNTVQDIASLKKLLHAAKTAKTKLIFKRVETNTTCQLLSQLTTNNQEEFFMAGFLFDWPTALLPLHDQTGRRSKFQLMQTSSDAFAQNLTKTQRAGQVSGR